jgi:hypothetical protein
MADARAEATLVQEGHARALEVLRACASEDGFLATPTDRANYRRVWGRDGSVMALAGLLSGEADLRDAARTTLRTLARYQGPHGEIPSNVDPATERVSYGGTAGRVDAGLWFAVACAELWRRSEDEAFLDEMLAPLERLRRLLGAWEFNTRGLLYVPPTGDWADEYVQSGYVLYDQLLYLQAQRGIGLLHDARHGSADHALDERIARLGHLIRANYWFEEAEEDGEDAPLPDDVYHPVLYEKGRATAGHCRGQHWLPFFSPLGYGTRFDAMANALASLLGVSDEARDAAVDGYVDERLIDDDPPVLPAFHPVITPKDEFWDELQMSFSHTFKNEPHRYHNGGRWALVTAFYAAALAQRGEEGRAERFRDAVHAANRAPRDGEAWSFSEYLHGRTYEPGGTWPMGWSAAAAVLADAYLDGERLFG